jgi:tRNA(Ile)-lysidine synthase
LVTQFSKHINTRFSFLKEKKLLIATSGGVDSMVLAQLLHQLDYDITLAHCNFCLRGKASDQDEAFVKQVAQKLQTPVFTQKFNTQQVAKQEKLSVQMAARKLRYDWFYKLTEEHQLDFIITAHHADDNLETFLINTIRGTGLDGLTGIPEQNDNIVRPLLPFTKEQIKAYATSNAISWREDHTNAEANYMRNKIRHKVIPVLKEINPSLLKSFCKTQENLKAGRQLIDEAMAKVKKKVVVSGNSTGGEQTDIQKVNIEYLKKLKYPKAYLYELLKQYGFTEWNDVANILRAQSGKQLFSATHRLVKDRNFLLLTVLQPEQKQECVYYINENDHFLENKDLKLAVTNVNSLSEKVSHKKAVLIDKDSLKFPLLVRKWQKGDYFYPFGMRGKKKVGKFFKDEKMSLLEKENSWLLCSNNEIVWVIGRRLDNRYKITNTTENILKIEIL